MDEERNIWLQITDEQMNTLENIWVNDTKHMIKMLQSLELKGEKVIDVACGTGAYYPFLSQRYTKYLGIDTSEKMLRAAKKKYPNAEFVVGDAKRLNYDDQTFDLVFCMGLFIHMPIKTIEKVLVGLWRISRKNVLFNLHITRSKTDTYIAKWGEFISVINRIDANVLVDRCRPKNTKEVVYGNVEQLSAYTHNDYKRECGDARFQGHLFMLEKRTEM